MIKRLHRGVLVALEGIDGSGKTTLARALADKLKERGMPVVLTKEPGATSLGIKIRELVQHEKQAISPVAESFLFAADRAQHIAHLVKPALASGSIVISDRMADSTRAYQGFARGVNRPFLEAIIAGALDGVAPDIVFYCALDLDTALQRLAQRRQEASRFEKENRSFYESVIQGFEEIFATRPDVVRLDAGQSAETLVDVAHRFLIDWLSKNSHKDIHLTGLNFDE